MIDISIKLTYKDVKAFVENLGYELISNEYKNNSTKLILKDKEGYYYVINIKNLKSSHLPCFVEKRNPYTIQNIKLWCKINNKPFELLSNIYKNNHELLKWQCFKDDCEEIFELAWHEIYNGIGCPFCAGKQVGLSNCLATKNTELAKQWHPTKNGDLTPYDVTCGCGKQVWWQCEKGHEWPAIIASRNYNRRYCPYCTHTLPSEEYNLLVINPELCKEWDYTKNKKKPEEYCPNSNKKVWWKCSKCNHEWKTTINSRNNNVGCPQCNESKGEKEIDKILKKYNIPHDSQYKFSDLRGVGNGLLKFDIPVFWDVEKTQLRLLIEYDGRQHFECVKGWITEEEFKSLQYHDKLKDEYCKKNNIILLRIPYWNFNNIENILNNYIIKI